MNTSLHIGLPGQGVAAEERERIEELLRYEKSLWAQGIGRIAGVDEAGRGPLAGPVVSAAVIFDKDVFIPEIDDSKRLRPEKREELYALIKKKALSIGVGIVEPAEIDQINILEATHKSMKLALTNLRITPEYLLVDGRELPQATIPQIAIVKGDSSCFSIAAASIIAKVTRDRIMREYDKKYPQYGFARHKGYSTREHREALRVHGPCPIHRRSFR